MAMMLWVVVLLGGCAVGRGSLSAAAAPKAYVGLFKDDSVAVVDTAQNKVLGTIAVPKGPHGLVVTPDGRKVYVSSDGHVSRDRRGACRPAPQRHAEPGRAHRMGGLAAAGCHGARPPGSHHMERSGAGTAGQNAPRARAESGRPTGLVHPCRGQCDPGTGYRHQPDRHTDPGGRLAALRTVHTRRPVGAGRGPGPR